MKSNLDQAIFEALVTHSELAYKCGVSVSTVNQWLKRSRNGSGYLPTGEAAKNIELTLRVKDFRPLFPFDWPEV